MTRTARLFAVAASLAVGLAIAGAAAEVYTFGLTQASTIARLEREIRQTVAARTADVQHLADAIAAEAPVVAASTDTHEHLPALFDRLRELTARRPGTAATIYVPVPATGDYTALAWSEGPGENAPATERLAGPEALFVAPGYAGLRLLLVSPLALPSQPAAAIVAETVLAPNEPGAPGPERRVQTSFGPVLMIEQYALAHDDRRLPNSFVVSTEAGVPLLEVRYEPADLAAERLGFRRHAAAAALLPLAVAVVLPVPALVVSARDPRRRRALLRILLALALVWGAAAALAGLASLADLPDGARQAIGALALLASAAIAPVSWWWRPRRRQPASAAPARFAVEQAMAGVTIAAAIELTAWLLARWTTPMSLDRWRYVLIPFDVQALLSFGTLLLLELAIAWSTGTVAATLAGRWRLRPVGRATAAALLLWIGPSAILFFVPTTHAHGVAWGGLVATGAAAGFAMASGWLRRTYRHTTQSSRLIAGFLLLLTPLLAFYPMSAATADRATRRLIADDYAPATAGQPQQLRAELARAQADVDALTLLPALVSAPPSADTRAAFEVWRRTSLSRTRVTSDVELYGPAGGLVSRFAFNLPEYIYRSSEPWKATTCTWDVFGEVAPFGAEARLMLHAMRGVCDETGRVLGGIVVHIASSDYQALPFLASANPYAEMLGVTAAQPQQPRLPDLQVTVYGWSARTIFTSGQAAWPVSPATFDRLYDPGEPFWTDLQADGQTWHVHFSQNRAGIYAIGYPRPTLFEHGTRLAEIGAIAAVFFVVLQVGAALAAPLTRRRDAALGRLFHEIRTSFYRKLFLLFVAVAIVPVVAFGVAFGSYMTARVSADVESEAKDLVTVAQRVFEELAAADERLTTTASAPSDDVMVWIRQVIGQDANLFEGSELVATSQRDLFDSGLLPTRTPANVYRDIALQRLRMDVVVDRLGEFTYLVAAAPVSVRGRDAILTVPLAPRQREIERETDELNRGVLLGSVLVILLAAGLGASVASQVADPVARLSRATRQVAAGNLDVRLQADSADELGRLMDDFNSMAETLGEQRAALARTNQLKAWNEMARQVAHEIKNPLTPIQLAAEHLQHVHEDRGRPLGNVVDQCLKTILGQVRLLRRIASEFANFAGEAKPRPEPVGLADLVNAVVDPYRTGLEDRIRFEVDLPGDLPQVWADRTLLSRALTNLVENAVQAMPSGGTIAIRAAAARDAVELRVEDTGMGMDAEALSRAFEPFFSTKTGGSGLGLANARRNVETGGGTVSIASAPGRGTTVTVTLPRPPGPGAAAGASSPSR